MTEYIIFIKAFYVFEPLFFPFQQLLSPKKNLPPLGQLLQQCRRPFNGYTDISTSPERNTLARCHIILLMYAMFNALTHFCVYCLVFSVVSRVVAGYCQSFLQLLLAADTGCRKSAKLQRFWGGGLLASCQSTVQQSTGDLKRNTKRLL